MKTFTLVLVSMMAVLSHAQTHTYELLQGPDQKQTLITIQKDLKSLRQDKELAKVNIMHESSDKECRVISQAQVLKAGEKFRLGYIYNSSSAPEITLELVSLDGSKLAAIECDSMSDEAGINIYNRILGDAVLMTNPN